MRRSEQRGRTDRGSATAELAVALPSLVVVLLVALQLLLAVAAQLRCVDAAGAAARAAARGEPDSAVVQVARLTAPEGAVVEVRRDSGLVTVHVSAVLQPLAGVLGQALAVELSGRATAADEAAP